MSYMKRTDNHNSALRKSGTKTKKVSPANPAEVIVSAVSKKAAALTAEKPLKTIKANSSAKVSAPLPKAKKAMPAKTAAAAKPTAIKKEIALTKENPAKKSKPVIGVKDSGKIAKPAVNSGGKSQKTVQPISDKTVKLKKEQVLPKTAGKKSKATEKNRAIAAAADNRKNKKNQAAAENKIATAKAAAAPKLKLNTAKSGKKSEVITPAKNRKLKTKSAEDEKKIATAAPLTFQKAKAKTGKTARKTEIPAPITKPKLRKEVEAIAEKAAKPRAKKIEKKIEIVPPVTVKPVKKKLKPIGSAVVRGKSGKYDFEVFPLDADLKDGSAIYVISKRITDMRGRGHHKFVCIGQTESLLGEIKRHKKDKCIKQHKANVICLLREESAANRLKIETDLREAHLIACNQK